MAEHPRVDELRRRVQQDPASIAFAQLAEECRRVGELDEAIRVCRTGLAHHPGYLSAHVTLGRALMALGHNEEARAEFEQVLAAAPDNLLALRCLEELGPSDAPDAGSGVEGRDQQPAEARRDGEPAVPAPDPVLEEPDPVLGELEGLLDAIRSDRVARGSGGT